jgi:hypothetical protein
MVLPLPLQLNVFERYMWADDNPQHPMSYFAQVAFSGRFDEQAFATALQQTLLRHPLLHARIDGDGTQTLTWVPSPDLLPYVDCADEPAPMHFPDTYRIDLRKENGLRVWVRKGADGGVIRFQFHHSCCDGIAVNQFIEDVLCLYDHAVRGGAGQPPGLRTVDFADLPRRNRFGCGWWDWLGRRLIDLWGTVVGPPIFLLGRPTPLQAPAQLRIHEQDGRALPELLTWRFSESQLTNLLARSRASRVTLNDLLLRDYFVAVHNWNLKHNDRLRRQSLRIMVPFNLRGPEHRALPAVNVVGMANLDRRLSLPWLRNPRMLLRTIQLETSFLKTFRIVTCFPCVMAVVDCLPGGLARILRQDRCLATTIVSNLGKIFAETPLQRRDGKLLAGELTVEAVDTAPPVRGGSGAASTFYTYAGQLSVTMNYDPHRFCPETAEQLFRHLIAQIERTADGAAAGAKDAAAAA